MIEEIKQLGKSKLSFECHYCPAVFVDFKSLLEHYHQKHDPQVDFETEKGERK